MESMPNRNLKYSIVVLFTIPIWIFYLLFSLEVRITILTWVLPFVFGLILFYGISNERKTHNQVSYLYPFKIIFFSFLLFIITAIIVCGITEGLTGIFGQIPTIISTIMIAVFLALIPVIACLFLIYKSKQKKKNQKDVLDSDL